MANAALPSFSTWANGQTVAASDMNAIQDAISGGLAAVWATVSANGTTVVGSTADAINVTATGAVTLTPPTGYAGRRVRVVKSASAVGGITWTGYGLLPGSKGGMALAWVLEYDGSAWQLVQGHGNGSIARASAVRTISGTTGTLSTDDGIVAINASGAFTLTLPSIAACVAAGVRAFFLQRKDIASAYALALALDAGDTAAKIYFLGNSPSAGASLTVTGADSQTRPGFTVWHDGSDWYLA